MSCLETRSISTRSRNICATISARWEAGLGWLQIATPPKAVKPLALMRYLIQMVTPPGGIILDPFMGSGSTLVAAAQLGFPAIGIELSEEYAEIAARRVDHMLEERDPQLALEGIA